MKIAIKTIAGVDATKVAIKKEALTAYAKAVSGKTVVVEIEPTASLEDLANAVKLEAKLEAPLEIHECQVYKGQHLAKGASLAACGINDRTNVSVKFVHKTS